MNQNLILRIVGVILCIEALCMIPPLLLSVFGGGPDQRAFLYALLICGGVGVLLSLIRADNTRLQPRDGFVCVALCWIALSVFGALPYFFSGSCSFIDAIFETVSGLTTTGASIFPSPASLPRGIQFWRALTQWMGGMGILVLMLALLPKLSEGSVNLMKAESPGPISTKLRPRTGETARILYRIYIALTVAEALLLRIAGLPLFDAITTALTTISTGGFSIRDASIAYYQSHLVNWILIFFMFAASVNFTLLYLCVTRRFREALKSEELRVYSLVVVGASAMIAADLIVRTGRDIGSAIENAAFQVTTLISTTGYCTEDFDLWPQFCRCILVLVMFFGGCAGSTAGGVKASRIVLLCKALRRDLRRVMHSREVPPAVRCDHHGADDDLYRRLFHPGCEHRVLSVASCQLDPHFLHVCRKRELYAPLPLRDAPLPRGAQERGAARLLAGRGRRVGDDRGGPDRAHGARHRLGHRECGLSGHNAHFNDRLLHGGF